MSVFSEKKKTQPSRNIPVHFIFFAFSFFWKFFAGTKKKRSRRIFYGNAQTTTYYEKKF